MIWRGTGAARAPRQNAVAMQHYAVLTSLSLSRHEIMRNASDARDRTLRADSFAHSLLCSDWLSLSRCSTFAEVRPCFVFDYSWHVTPTPSSERPTRLAMVCKDSDERERFESDSADRMGPLAKWAQLPVRPHDNKAED